MRELPGEPADLRLAQCGKRSRRRRAIVADAMPSGGRALRVLVVHESGAIAKHTVMLLERLGCEATAVASGPLALAAATSLEPDAVMISLTVTGDAFIVGQELRAKAAPREVRIVAMSRAGRTPPGGVFDSCVRMPIAGDALRVALALDRQRR